MALSNWLTRQEWNGAFVLYICEAQNGNAPYPVDMSAHLHGGICFMDKAGYKNWTGIKVGNNEDPDTVHKAEGTRYGSRACTAEGDNSGALVEIMTGQLDGHARMMEFLEWAKGHPELNLTKYQALLDEMADTAPKSKKKKKK